MTKFNYKDLGGMRIAKHSRDAKFKIFWTRALPVGVHSNRPFLSVSLSFFKYLRDRSLVFSETLHEVSGQLSKKSDTVEILKKNLNPGIKGD